MFCRAQETLRSLSNIRFVSIHCEWLLFYPFLPFLLRLGSFTENIEALFVEFDELASQKNCDGLMNFIQLEINIT